MRLAVLFLTVTFNLHSGKGAAWYSVKHHHHHHGQPRQETSSIAATATAAVTPNDEPKRTTLQVNTVVASQEQHNEALFGLGQAMLAGSDLIYSFAALRKAAVAYMRRGMKLIEPELILPELEPSTSSFFNLAALVPALQAKIALAVNSPRDGFSTIVTIPIDRAMNQYLNQEIPAIDVYDFLVKNKEFCLNSTDFDAEDIKNTLKPFLKLCLGVVAFEDEFQESELVFGITINRTQKRITVLFRGSVTDNDWKTNAKLFFTPLRVNQTMFRKELRGKIKVHSGINGYLNDALDEQKKKKNSELQELVQAWAKEYNWPSWLSNREDEELRMTKMDDVVQNILDVYNIPTYKDYKLCISGHSLGAALGQLLTLQLAIDERLTNKVPYPITAITFASPCVGNDEFRKAFQHLEAMGRVRHVRISNEGDVIAVVPPQFVGYTQTGVHVHVPKDTGKVLEVGYRLVKPFIPQLWTGWSYAGWKLSALFKSHELDEHHRRLFNSTTEDNKKILLDSPEDLYKKYAGDHTA